MSIKKNPNNPESTLYKLLTRLFSGPMVSYRQQAVRVPKHRNMTKYNGRIKTANGKAFSKQSFNVMQTLQSNYLNQFHRSQRYVEFQQMEFSPELAAGMDIYADEMTTHTDLSPLLGIRCANEEIKEELHTLYYDILNVEFNLFGWARTMCKYGDMFLYLELDPEHGVRSVIPIPTAEVERLEGEDDTNPNYIQFQWNSGGMTFENWQMAHFRILGNDKYAPYGSSILDPARRIYRQLTLIEEAMMSYRIVRSPERRVFYVDVGNVSNDDVPELMEQIKTNMKRNEVVDYDTGKTDLRYNAMSIDEDFYIPVRGPGDSTRIEPLPGGTYTGDIDDVKYLRDKLFSAIKIPMSYLSRGEGTGEDKETLAQKDIRFARTIQRLQRSVISELEKIGRIHLFINGYRGKELISFKLNLNNPSKIAEMQELEQWRTRFDVASSATDGFFSKSWIAKKLFNMSDDEIVRNQREMYYDRHLTAQLDAIESGDGGSEFGGTSGTGEDSFDTSNDVADSIGSGEEEILLAKPGPGRRSDPYLTPGAKGKVHYPPITDKRDMGARKRSYNSKYSSETASGTSRNIFKGGSGLKSLSKGIYESQEKSEYDNEEEEIFRVNSDIEALLEGLKDIDSKGIKEEINSRNKTIVINGKNKYEKKNKDPQ